MEVQIFYNNILHHYKKTDEICFVTGQCIFEGAGYRGKLFSEKILHLDNLNTSLPFNGNYSFIRIKEEKIDLVTDHIRSYPLFYSQIKNYLFISDNANWIKEKSDNAIIDAHAIQEMKLSGYVLGNKTLYKEIKQLQAGEKIQFNLEGNLNQIKPKSTRFFEYYPNSSVNKSMDEYAEEHKTILSEIFKKLIKEHEGKTFVVPLSGGLDSRLIVSELKKRGCINVVCFTYGKVSNAESLISKEIASKLGYDWFFVEYTRDTWREAYKSSSFQKYLYTTDNFCSLPHIQDWPCIWKLKKENKIPSDSVMLPGHTGDFLATGHIPLNLNDSSTIDEFLLEIIKKHFRVNQFSSLSRNEKKYIQGRILDVLPQGKKKDGEILKKESFQYFDWQERQAKFIVNSVRVYDFFNYEWSIPLWGIELINFWKNIPFEFKKGKLLYKHYLYKYDDFNLFPELKGKAVAKNQVRKQDGIIKGTLKRFKRVLMRRKLFLEKRFLYYFNHPFQWYGMFSYGKIIFSRSRIQNINTLLVNEYLNKIKNG